MSPRMITISSFLLLLVVVGVLLLPLFLALSEG